MGRFSYFILALILIPSLLHAGALTDFFGKVNETIGHYNDNMMTTGNNVNAAIKNKDLNAAFEGYLRDSQKTGNDALSDSKALGKALKDVALAIPKAIKKMWDSLIDFIMKLRDRIFAHSSTEEPAPATEEPAPDTEEPAPDTEEPAPATEEPAPVMEDDEDVIENRALIEKASHTNNAFVSCFDSIQDYKLKLDTFCSYSSKTHKLLSLIDKLEQDQRGALSSRIDFLLDELKGMQDSLENDIEKAVSSHVDSAVIRALINKLESSSSDIEELSPLLKTARRILNNSAINKQDVPGDDLQRLREYLDN